MESATVVLYPDPTIGHLVSMVEFGKLIHKHHPSLSVTIIIIPTPTQQTGSTDKYINTVLATTPSITFHHLPAVVIPPDFTSVHLDRAFGIPELYNTFFHNTLVAISEKSSIKAVILDCFTNAGFQVAKNLHLPTYYFFTGGASLLCVFLNIPNLHKTKFVKDSYTWFDIPGVPLIHASDMQPGLLVEESNTFKNFSITSINLANSSGIILNTFTGFEKRALDTLRGGKCVPVTPPVYLVGPLIASANEVAENECLKWLQTQPSKSVVFLCFGSMGVFKKEQLNEIAIGLERSEQRFLWVLRDPPPDESNSGGEEVEVEGFPFLPDGFLTRTMGRGLVVKNWAPQQAVLSHGSVGGFVSHCGWNSILESIVAGVPMVAWPLYAEQKLNRVYLVKELKVAVGLEMGTDDFVAAEEVEEKVRELMEGKVVRERVLEMSEMAKAAVEDGGSSRVELFKLTQPWLI